MARKRSAGLDPFDATVTLVEACREALSRGDFDEADACILWVLRHATSILDTCQRERATGVKAEPRTTREDSTDKPVWRCPDCGERYYDAAPQVCSLCGTERKR